MELDPWGSSQYQDYDKLRSQFGISDFGAAQWNVFSNPHHLFRRNVVFGHRDFGQVAHAIRGKDPWAVMTGLMPSGPMHFGHKMLLDQVVAHQQEGASIHLAVADFEAAAARGMSLGKAREIAENEYIANYLALGIEPGQAEVYFQTTRHRVKDLAHRFSTKVNLSQLQALYGFGGDTSIAHIQAPIVQAADILHVQCDDLGPRPVLVPVGVDQDPHLRLTRDIAGAWGKTKVRFDEQKGEHFVVVRGDEKVQAWLDRIDAVLDAQGLGTRAGRKRNDKYSRISLGRKLTSGEKIALELALAAMNQKKDPEGIALARPSSTYHRFMTGLTGGKMSSSQPESAVFLNDTPDAAAAKVKRSVTGGRASADEQRKLGAEPEKCPIYEMYLYHLATDDNHLQTVYDECKGGQRLCGGCKSEAVELLGNVLTDLQEKRESRRESMADLVARD